MFSCPGVKGSKSILSNVLSLIIFMPSTTAVEDLNLEAVVALQGVAYLAIGKHLCGPATDKRYFSDLGLTKEDFHAISWFTSWAVDADHGSEFSVMDHSAQLEIMCEKKEFCLDSDLCAVEVIVRDMLPIDRAVLGFMCKDIIDFGRLKWVEAQGLKSELVKYVPSSISPENNLLVAKYMRTS